MSKFPAEKTIALIRQLHEAGIHINLMAHSLGNDVLMHVLNLCAEEGIQLDHAFLWEAAIPDDAFKTQAKWYFPMPNPQKPEQLSQRLPYTYNYTHAENGAKAVTVLYSSHDNIIGPMPTESANSHPNPMNPMGGESVKALSHAMLQQLVRDGLVMGNVELQSEAYDLVKQHPLLASAGSDGVLDWVALEGTHPNSIAAAEAITESKDSHTARFTHQTL